MSRIETHFVKPLADFYGRNPYGPGFARKLEPYAATLNEEVLSSVASRIMETGKSFPSFAACRSALQASETAMSAPISTEPRPWQTQQKDKLEWKARLEAVKLCRCPMGEQADREGWLPALIEFAQDRGRLPNEREIPAVRAKARRSDEALDASRGTPFYASLVTWRKNMMERASKDVFGKNEGYRAPEEYFDRKAQIADA